MICLFYAIFYKGINIYRCQVLFKTELMYFKPSTRAEITVYCRHLLTGSWATVLKAVLGTGLSLFSPSSSDISGPYKNAMSKNNNLKLHLNCKFTD